MIADRPTIRTAFCASAIVVAKSASRQVTGEWSANWTYPQAGLWEDCEGVSTLGDCRRRPV
jgi:hypothetical protein